MQWRTAEHSMGDGPGFRACTFTPKPPVRLTLRLTVQLVEMSYILFHE